MSINEFEVGRAYSGVLVTVNNRLEHRFPATLKFDEIQGVIFEVAAQANGSMFGAEPSHESVWFRGDAELPEQCVFESLDGNVTLSGIRTTKRSQNWRVAGAWFTADEVVLGGTRTQVDIRATYDELHSRLDGLADWWGARNIVEKKHFGDNGLLRGIQIATLDDVEPICWQQNGASMRIELGWTGSTADSGRSHSLSQTTNLVSVFPDPVGAQGHLDEHWKVKSLLALLMGRPTPYRWHGIKSKASFFDELPLDQSPRPRFSPVRAFVTSRTVRDFPAPSTNSNAFSQPIFHLTEVGPTGLERWGAAWTPEWERLIAPVVAGINRRHPYIEDEILAAGIFLDAWGKKAAKVESESLTYSQSGKPKLATQIFRAMAQTGADWSEVAVSPAGLAQALHVVYTSVKHAENKQPGVQEMSFAADAMTLIVRMVAARQVDVGGELVARFASSWSMRKQLQGLVQAGLIVDEAGIFVQRSSVRPESTGEGAIE